MGIFTDIGNYIQSLRDNTNGEPEPAIKKRKLDTPRDSPAPAPPPPAISKPSADGAVLKVEGISFMVPQRKKFNLVLTATGVSAVTTAGDVEFGVEYDNIGMFATTISPPSSVLLVGGQD